MIYVSKTVPINPAGSDRRLTRHEMWLGLMMKAENALPFVPGMTVCDVIEKHDHQLVRNIVFRGEPASERVSFYPEKRLVFLRLSGNADGFIVNEIIEDAQGELNLRFSFALQLHEAESGSEAEDGFRAVMETDYVVAVDKTIDAARRAAIEGLLAAA